ncbi:MAG: histone H1 [Alphaproteobacteria bacterium]|nr:histone H1 [Alphaproteobacteria bacterium]
MSRFDEIRDLVMSLEADFDAFYEKGNKAAGRRVRKGMQQIKKMAQDIRVDVQARVNQ